MESNDATRNQNDEVGGRYCANEGGEIAERCVAVVTFRGKKKTKRAHKSEKYILMSSETDICGK